MRGEYSPVSVSTGGPHDTWLRGTRSARNDGLEISPGDDRSALAARVARERRPAAPFTVTPGECSDMACSPIASLKAER